MTEYRASPDGLVLAITTVVVLVLGGIAVGAIVAFVSERLPTPWRWVFLLPAVLCLGILAVAWLYTPSTFRVEGDKLVITRPASNVVVPFSDIVDVRPEPSPLSGSIRLGGNGGLFGFWGKFHSQSLGNFTLYGRRAKNGVVLVTSGRTVVVMPDDPDRFVADLRQRVGRRVSG